jgi:hypothetical protein
LEKKSLTGVEIFTYLTFKFGTLKAWDIRYFKDQKKALALLKERASYGVSPSVILQRDNERQRKILFELIDLCIEDKIYLDDEVRVVSKKKAKNYLKEFHEIDTIFHKIFNF